MSDLSPPSGAEIEQNSRVAVAKPLSAYIKSTRLSLYNAASRTSGRICCGENFSTGT
jgi:hypothetical protein